MGVDHAEGAVPGVRLEDVRFRYRRRADPVLSELTLSLPGPGSVGLLGPNGSGKSTLVKLVAGVLRPETGQLKIAGISVGGAGAMRDVHRIVGYLPQRFGFFKGFTAEEFVRYCLWVRGAPSPASVCREALSAVGMDELRAARMGSLSGGQVQRVGIAQAIAGQPPLVILDEPSAGLDPEQRIQLRTALRALDSSLVIMSTHLIEDVVLSTETVVVISGGKIVHQGATEGLGERARAGYEREVGCSVAEGAYLTLIAARGLHQ